jgi:hypothetical protein
VLPTGQPLQISKGAKQKVEKPEKFAAKFWSFFTERAEKGPIIWKICIHLLISLNLGMFKKYYMFQFSH